MVEKEQKKLTPYQGNRRCFGKFICSKCEKQWTSASSWANTWQKCFTCKKPVYPVNQWKLEKRKGKADKNKPHLQDHCGKCQKLGTCCINCRII